MRKSKVVAVTMGMIASVLFGGYAVTDAATVTLDDSTAPEIKGAEVKTAAPEATIKTSPESAAPASQANESISTAPPERAFLKISAEYLFPRKLSKNQKSVQPRLRLLPHRKPLHRLKPSVPNRSLQNP